MAFISSRVSQKIAAWLYSLWKFSRPHTIVGTSLSIIGVYLIAVVNGDRLNAYAIAPILLPWIACLCGNVYIVGLNQLEDVEIDKINKPHLPIAAGEFSYLQAQQIVAVTGTLAILLSSAGSFWLFATVAISLAIGTAYSVPPVRLKRFPFWASFCILSVRGAIVNLGLFLHFNDGVPVPPSVWALTAFVIVFTFAIAIFKDIPDIEGDKQFNISTFTIELGKEAVFNLARWVVTICYLAMAIAGISGVVGVNSTFLIVTHLLILAVFWGRSFATDLDVKSSIYSCYQFIWKLFFLEYLLFPVACMLPH